MTLARARVHSEFSPGNALRQRDIPKRYILTFLKRDGHVHTSRPIGIYVCGYKARGPS